MQTHRCALFPFWPLGLHDAAMDGGEFIILLLHKYIISSFANFEATPAASYQFAHFTSPTLAWKSDSWYPLSHHCYLCIVNRMRGGVVIATPHWRNSHSTVLLSGNQRRRLQQVAWVGLSWGLLLWFLFIYLFFLYFTERVFHHMESAQNINSWKDGGGGKFHILLRWL